MSATQYSYQEIQDIINLPHKAVYIPCNPDDHSEIWQMVKDERGLYQLRLRHEIIPQPEFEVRYQQLVQLYGFVDVVGDTYRVQPYVLGALRVGSVMRDCIIENVEKAHHRQVALNRLKEIYPGVEDMDASAIRIKSDDDVENEPENDPENDIDLGDDDIEEMSEELKGMIAFKYLNEMTDEEYYNECKDDIEQEIKKSLRTVSKEEARMAAAHFYMLEHKEEVLGMKESVKRALAFQKGIQVLNNKG